LRSLEFPRKEDWGEKSEGRKWKVKERPRRRKEGQ